MNKPNPLTELLKSMGLRLKSHYEEEDIKANEAAWELIECLNEKFKDEKKSEFCLLRTLYWAILIHCNACSDSRDSAYVRIKALGELLLSGLMDIPEDKWGDPRYLKYKEIIEQKEEELRKIREEKANKKENEECSTIK